MRKIWATLALSFIFNFANAAPAPVRPVEAFDTNAYLGKWYEIARIENEFQISCRGTTATYSLKEDKTFDVDNSCWVGEGSQEKRRVAHGHAWLDENKPGTMKVSFVHFIVWWKPFASDYWIIEAGPQDSSGQYQYAIIGHPRRRYGWIMSRTAAIDDLTYAELMNKVKANGYDPEQFKRTDQSMNQSPKL